MGHTGWFFTAEGQDCIEARRKDLKFRQLDSSLGSTQPPINHLSC